MLPRVLFVDDDTIFLQMVARSLKDVITPLTVANPTEALQVARENLPILIVIDYRMPGMNGIELIKEFQQHDATAAVPVWMISGQEDEDLIAAVYDLGVADYLPKPVPMKMLRAKIARYIEHEAHAAEIAASLTRAERYVKDLHNTERIRALASTSLPGLDLGTIYRPLQQVGGDFFDIVATRRGTHVVVVGDVSGHGIEAGLLQTMSRKLIQLAIRDSDSLEEALHVANGELRDDLPPATFVAAGLAEWHPERRTLRIMRMGIPHPLQRGADGSVELMMVGGTTLGLHKPERLNRFLTPLEVELAPGDVVLLYTDGLIEAHTPAGEEVGFETLRELLAAATGDDGQKLAESLLAGVEAAKIELNDDLTALVLKCTASS
ncbi:MAG: PP2C family protein-serine/threonine phosphatase [Planctomycetota bacterium]